MTDENNKPQADATSQRVYSFFGKDPSKPIKPSSEIFSRVLAKRQQKEDEEAEKKAEEIIEKVALLHKQRVEARSAFEKGDKKVKEEIDKIMSTVDEVLKNRSEASKKSATNQAEPPKAPVPTEAEVVSSPDGPEEVKSV